MSVGSKVKMIPTIIVIAILGLAALAIVPSVTKSMRGRGNPVFVVVSFVPEVRTGKTAPGGTFPDTVFVEFIVGGGAGDKDPVTRSPWQRTIYPPKGTLVQVIASQVHGGALGCLITHEGKPDSFQEKPGACMVSCRMVAA